MGTNYYLYQSPPCECCGRPYEPLHIGKSSAGWCFGLHVMPEDGINTLDDWRKLWNQPGAVIKDECDTVISAQEMELTITARCRFEEWDDRRWWGYRYRSEEHFHDVNESERGPNGLLRHRIDRYCIGHGEGPWDYMVGEFS